VLSRTRAYEWASGGARARAAVLTRRKVAKLGASPRVTFLYAICGASMGE